VRIRSDDFRDMQPIPDDCAFGRPGAADAPCVPSANQSPHLAWDQVPDGTRSFVAGRPIFGTLVALLDQTKPVLGMIDQPISGERWLGAAGQPSTLNGAPIRTRACDGIAQAHLATTGPGYFGPESWTAFERVRAAARDTLWGGDCYNYGLLAAGHLDLVIEDGLKLYDFAALVPIVEGAGGRMRDWCGKALDMHSDGRVIAAGDPRLIDLAIAVLA